MPLANPALTKFTTTSSNIASYDYQDIINGTGVIEFNLAAWTETTNESYFLTPSSVHSDGTYFAFSQASGGHSGTSSDFDFDIQFNVPKSVRGDIYVSLPYYSFSAGSVTMGASANVGVYHWDGTTETQIGGGADLVSPSIDRAAGYWLFKFTQATIQHFKKGEIFRLKVNLNVSSTTGTANLYIGCDPSNTTLSGTVGSNSKVYISTILDI